MKTEVPSSIKILVVLLSMTTDLYANLFPAGSFQTRGMIGSTDIFNQIALSLKFGNVPTPPVAKLEFLLSKDDVDRTISVSSGTEFDHTVSYLTNGINDRVAVSICAFPGNGTEGSFKSSEAKLFFGDATGAQGIDFQGIEIASVNITLSSLHFSTPGRDPNKDGTWTDASYEATVSVNTYSPVTEPSLLVILGIGLICLIMYRKIQVEI